MKGGREGGRGRGESSSFALLLFVWHEGRVESLLFLASQMASEMATSKYPCICKLQSGWGNRREGGRGEGEGDREGEGETEGGREGGKEPSRFKEGVGRSN